MRILLAVDGSDQSYEAAKALAHLAHAEQVIVLHVLDVPKPAYPMMMPEVAQDIYTTVEKTMREEGDRLVHRIAAMLPMGAGPVTRRLEVGSPSEMIASVAHEQRADVIVMGARGLGPIQERLFGSVSHRVITEAPCATLVVSGPMPSLRRILLCVQGPEDADRAIHFLASKPFRGAGELTALTVLPFTQPPWPADASVTDAMRKEVLEGASFFIEDLAKRLSELGHQAKGTARLGNPVPMIFEEAARLKPDLIMLGSRGRKGVARFVLGSVSHAVLHRMPCAVLVIR
jgi:nucleotide-binding universal stress UspA family protein